MTLHVCYTWLLANVLNIIFLCFKWEQFSGIGDIFSLIPPLCLSMAVSSPVLVIMAGAMLFVAVAPFSIAERFAGWVFISTGIVLLCGLITMLIIKENEWRWLSQLFPASLSLAISVIIRYPQFKKMILASN